ncbi:MAG: sigma 54-interacting transcriptional regulator [Deltaproteobacteria bacterium]|nr:sigma 54-interacting transcriptional regulator [Deltaproteobacteria bacterium]
MGDAASGPLVIDGKYRVRQRIAGGGFSEVFLVDGPEGPCALKLLHAGHALPANSLEAFKNEFSLLKNFRHPNIARILDFGLDEASGRYYFTAELITGIPLVKAAQEVPLARITDWMVEVLRALAFIHARRCYHFDIKSNNVLVVADGIRLIDFGLAGIDPHGRLIGTPSYMAPEIVGRETPDHRADLYSLGVLWYYCVTGCNPFWTVATEEALERQLRYVPPVPSTVNDLVPPWMDQCIMRLLAKNPMHRFASAALAIQAINQHGGYRYPLETETTLLSYIPETGALIGRREECAAIACAIDQILAGDITADGWWIAGPLGSGKTRLLKEMKYAAQLAGVPVTWMTAGEAKSIDTWCDALEAHAATGSGARCFILDQAEASAQDDAAARRLMGSLFRVLRPTGASRALVLIGLRAEAAPELAEAIGSLLPHRCQLAAFTHEELRAYLKELTGLPDPPEAFVAELFRRTEGNPLFVTEVVKALIQSGGLFDSHGRWQKSLFEDLGVDFSRILVPHSLEGLLLDRALRLPKPARQILAALATAGRSATATELAAWTALPPVAATLHELVAEDLLLCVGPLAYDFRNALLGPTIYESLPKAERAHYHDRIAATCKADGQAEEALRHRSLGSDRPQAIAAASELGTRQLQRGYGRHAAAFLERALELTPETSQEERVRLLLQIGEAHLITHAYAKAEHCLTQVETVLAGATDSPTIRQWQIATALRFSGMACKMHAFDRAGRMLDRAADLLTDSVADDVARLRIANFRGAIHLAQGRREAARDLFAATREKTRALPPDQAARVTNNDLGLALLHCGDPVQAERILRDDLAQAVRLGDDLLIARAHYTLADVAVTGRRYADATTAYERCVEVCRRSENTELLLRAYNGLGNVRQLMGDLQGSREYYERGLALHERAGDLRGGAAIAINLAIVEHARGAPRAAADLLLPSLRLLEQLPEKTAADWNAVARGHLEMAEIEWKTDRSEEAKTRIGELLALAHNETPLQAYRFWGGLLLAQILRAEGNHAECAHRLAEIEPLIRTVEEREHFDRMTAEASGPGVHPATPVPSVSQTSHERPRDDVWSISGTQWLREESFRRILEINRTLNAEHDLGFVLKMVLHYALELAQAESGAILLAQPDGTLAVACQRDLKVDAEELRFSQALAHQVLQTNQWIVTDDALADPRFAAERSIAEHQLRSILCLPIRSQKRIVGVLYLNHRFRAGAFRQTDLQLLEAYTDLAGIAIANAQLIAELQRRETSLHSELSMATSRLKEFEEQIHARGTEVPPPLFGSMVGHGRVMQTVSRLCEKVADTDLGVLILGESGTGKELIARGLHENHQRRREGRFVAINCGAIPPSLMESELFGYKAGAFTGASRDKRGWLAEADGGTLFLDEVAELAPTLQVKLLRVLQEKEFTRVGDTRPSSCDMRVIAASNRNVEQSVKDGTFREDLYYRLCQVTIKLPPLRERAEDIPALVHTFLREAAPKRALSVTPAVMRRLIEYPWPGNVRELQNTVQVASALCEGDRIDMTSLPPHIGGMAVPAPAATPREISSAARAIPTIALDEQNRYDPTLSLHDYEICIIAKAFQTNEYRARPTAKELGIALATLYKRLREGNLLDRTLPIYATPFVYQRGRTLRDYRPLIFRAAYEQAHHRPYLAVAALKISQGYFHKVMRQHPIPAPAPNEG